MEKLFFKDNSLQLDNKLQACYLLARRIKCFDITKYLKYDFEGYPLRALFSSEAYTDHLFPTEILKTLGNYFNFTITFEEAKKPTNWGTTPDPRKSLSDINAYSGTERLQLMTLI